MRRDAVGRTAWRRGTAYRRSTLVRSRRMTALAAALLAPVALAAAGGAEPASARWATTTSVTATLVAGTLPPITSVSCGSSGGLLGGDIPITWTTPSGPGVLAPQSYTLAWSGSAGSGSRTVPAPATGGTVSGATLTLLGSSTVSVTSNYGGWRSPPSQQTRTISTVVGALGLVVAWTCG